jgi:hypothetical protein
MNAASPCVPLALALGMGKATVLKVLHATEVSISQPAATTSPG